MWPWKPVPSKECVKAHQPNVVALKMDRSDLLRLDWAGRVVALVAWNKFTLPGRVLLQLGRKEDSSPSLDRL